MPWAPVCLGIGIGLYFLWPTEPARGALVIAALIVGLALATRAMLSERAHVPALALALVAFGLLLMTARAHMVAAPVMPYRYYGPIEGRVIDIDRSFSDALRVTLDHVALNDTIAPAETPAQVRVSLHGDDGGASLLPGMRIRVTGLLAPPDGPAEPGGFDFQRLAWFSGLGGVGYTRDPVTLLAPADPWDWRLMAFRLRMALSGQMQDQMGGGQAAALSSAFMTGDRSGITAETNEAMRAANLSHLISISGLHMGLITGFVFATLRFGIALVPFVALRVDARKIAAGAALAAATFYLALAGPDVATRRSYIMAAIMMAGVLADRRAISLRSVALSALVVLVLEPESLVEPGFQMSYAATIALIVSFGFWPLVQARLPRLMQPVAMAVLSSVVAGTATAPIAAVHFNRLTEYGLIANLLSTPLMGLMVMPAGVLSLLLLPLGLAGPALWVMKTGTAGVLMIAHAVAGWNGAVLPVPAPPGAVLPLIAFGGLLGLIGRGGWLRGAGVALLCAALMLWGQTLRPTLLIAGDGGLVGLMTPEGRALSKPKGAGFIGKSWLEDDGDGADQETAAARGAFTGKRGDRRASFGGHPLLHLTGKTAAARLAPECHDGAIIVINDDWRAPTPGDCQIFDLRRLRRTGAVAIDIRNGALHLTTARAAAGKRLWNTRAPRRYTKTDGAAPPKGAATEAVTTNPAPPAGASSPPPGASSPPAGASSPDGGAESAAAADQ